MEEKPVYSTDNPQLIIDDFIDGMGRISKFWGFGKIMGQLYGLLYLSPAPMTLDQLAEGLQVSKGSVSTNARALERWGMVEKIWIKADRKDYYRAKTRFMEIIIGIFEKREKAEFDTALRTVSACLEKAALAPRSEEAEFLQGRLREMQDFFNFLDGSVSSMLFMLKSQFER